MRDSEHYNALNDAMRVDIPLRTGNGQNNREHWRVASKRAKNERSTVLLGLLVARERPILPCVVTVTRIAPSNGLDAHDNLRGAMKHAVDAIADWLGKPDNCPDIEWRYRQERGVLGIRIEVKPSSP